MAKKNIKKRMKKERIFRESLNYIGESRNYIYFALSIFILGAFIGFLFPEVFSSFLNEIIKALIEKTKGLNMAEMVFFIFQNNTMSAFSTIVLGIFIGIFPILSIFVNGILLGYVMSKAIAIEGWLTVLRLAPHGVFELPAIFISVGLGIKLGLVWFSGKERGKEFKRRLWKSLKVFLVIVLPLLIVAAIIEGILISLSG